MVEHDDTLPRKTPTQERSRALVDALVEATARVLAMEGLEAVTTNRVADVAGVSIGSLYQYFPNKESLIAAVIERELDRDMTFVHELFEACAEEPLARLVRRLLGELVEETKRRRALHQQMLPLIDDLHRAQLVHKKREMMSALFTSLIMDRADELPARLREGKDASERMRCAALVTMRATELGLNAIKVESPALLDRPELPELLARIFEAVMLDP